MADLGLAFVHHAAIFTLIAIFVAELTIVRAGMCPDDVRRVSRIDAWYGFVAGVVLAVGIVRVIYGGKGWAFYQSNPLFWVKMALFGVVGALSAAPTIAFIRWRRDQKGEADAIPAPERIASVRRWLVIEGVLLAAIPLTAAAMARYPF
jgi:putative membrane protein